MLLGLGEKKKSVTPETDAPIEAIYDVDTADFEQKVILASMETPILVDFWAPWCGPCKQLGPVLEAAVKESGGKVRMAKVNIDDNQELAQALRIQSVPTVFAFFQGQPVTAFAGARPQSEIKALIDQLAKMAAQSKPDAIDIPAALKQAAEFIAAGDIAAAQGLYAQILRQDEKNASAYAGLVRSFIAAGEIEQAKRMLAGAPEAIAAHPDFAAAKSALELAQNRPDQKAVLALAGRIEKNPDDHLARFDLALALFAAGQKEEAVDALLEIIRRNRGWEEDKARKQLLQFFEALGPADPLTVAGRRKLSSVLFS